MTPVPSNSRWPRFIDKLAGGPPNLEKLEAIKGKRWFMRYNVSLFMLAFSLPVLVIPELVTHLNGTPDPTMLRTLQVRIMRTHATEPHLFVELPGGIQRGMEWPVPISYHGGFRSNVWSDEVREQLKGCLATVRGVQLRWTVSDRFRVWELECPEKRIRIDLAKTTSSYATWLKTGISVGLVIFPITYLFTFVNFLREKRGNL